MLPKSLFFFFSWFLQGRCYQLFTTTNHKRNEIVDHNGLDETAWTVHGAGYHKDLLNLKLCYEDGRGNKEMGKRLFSWK